MECGNLIYAGTKTSKCFSDEFLTTVQQKTSISTEVPAMISPYVAAKLGPSYARRVFLNGKIMTAAEAQRYGLVHEVVSAAELDNAVNAEIDLALACAPGAVQMTKKLVQFVLAHDTADNLIYTVDRLADFWETEEAREGIVAGEQPVVNLLGRGQRQGALRGLLQLRRAEGRVSRITSLWIANGLAVTATRPSAIQRSASRREQRPARAMTLAMRSPSGASAACSDSVLSVMAT